MEELIIKQQKPRPLGVKNIMKRRKTIQIKNKNLKYYSHTDKPKVKELGKIHYSLQKKIEKILSKNFAI